MRVCKSHDALGCPMTRINKVSGQGPIPCSIMLIGEAPGKTEDAKGKPFIGKAGSELDFLYLRDCARLVRESVYVTNLVKCRTNDKDRDPTAKEIEACSWLLYDELDTVRPRFIGLIGRLSTRWALGEHVRMEKAHGFGYAVVLEHPFECAPLPCKVMPLYHPAFGLHNTTMIRHIMEDFTRFGRMIRGDAGVMWRERT